MITIDKDAIVGWYKTFREDVILISVAHDNTRERLVTLFRPDHSPRTYKLNRWFGHEVTKIDDIL